MSYKEILQINHAINLLIDIKNILRQETPTRTMNEANLQEVSDFLLELNKTLTKLNISFGIQFVPETGKSENFNQVFMFGSR